MQEEENFTEELGYLIQTKLLERWPFDNNDKEWNKLKIIFQQSRLRILYTSEESHEWVLYIDNNNNNNNNNIIDDIDIDDNNNNNKETQSITDNIANYALIDEISASHHHHHQHTRTDSNDLDFLTNDNDLECLGGVYQKFNFEFGDGKFHDIVSMGSTQNIGWNVLDSSNFDPYVLCNVGNILNLQRKINNKYGFRLPAELWHIILGFSVDCFQPITQMVCMYILHILIHGLYNSIIIIIII